MPAINTNNTENTDIFQTILNTLLENKPLSQYPENTLFKFMDYLASHTGFREISTIDLNKLTSIHAKFSSFYCSENLHSNNNQTTPDSYSQFLKFSQALKDKEEFFHPSYTSIKTDCETTLNTDSQTPTNSIVQLSTAATHGFLAGSVNAFTSIAFESVKSNGYSKKQLRLIKFGLDVVNSLTIASYASLAAYTEHSQESHEVILEKMWQSFLLSLTSTGVLYALTNGISYFSKSIENRFVKGALNALPLAGNLSLLAIGENKKQTGVMLGVNCASASATSAAIQNGWHFFSKRGNTAQNRDLALELSTNTIENTLPSLDETSFFINENSINTNIHHYEVIDKTNVNEEEGYLCMKRESQYDSNGYLIPNPSTSITGTTIKPTLYLDSNGYSFPKPPTPVTNPTVDNSGYSRPKPPMPVASLTTPAPTPSLPFRNQQFFSNGGLNISANVNQNDVSQSYADPSHSYNP